MRVWFTNTLLLGAAIAFLWHFCMIAWWGQVIIQEPCLAILVSEIVLFVAIIGFAICNMINQARRF